MKKSELKKLIQESINEVYEEQNTIRILREDFDRDVATLEEQQVLCEGLVENGVLTEEQVDEAFFDTIKNLGKNAVASVAASWKKAKAQGDRDEMKRLEKKLAALKAKSGGGSKSSKVGSRTSKSSETTPQSGTQTGRTDTKNKKQNQQNRQKIAAKAGETILTAVAKQDPKTAAAIQKAGPEKVTAALKNPKVKIKADKIAAEIAKEKPADPKQGFLGKVSSWMKKNPVKGAAAIALLGVVATAAAVGSGGVLPLMGTMLTAGAKGAVIGGGLGGLVRGGMALGKGQGLAAAAKEFGKGAVQGAKSGFLGGAVGGFLGSAFQGFSQGFQQLMSVGSGTASVGELEKAQQTLDAKSQEVEKSPEGPQQQKSALAQRMDNEINTLRARANALNSLGLSKAQVFGLNDGNFKVVGSDGVDHFFNKSGTEITDSNIISKLSADDASFRKAFNSVDRYNPTVPVTNKVSSIEPANF
jgi:hypothetical protein